MADKHVCVNASREMRMLRWRRLFPTFGLGALCNSSSGPEVLTEPCC